MTTLIIVLGSVVALLGLQLDYFLEGVWKQRVRWIAMAVVVILMFVAIRSDRTQAAEVEREKVLLRNRLGTLQATLDTRNTQLDQLQKMIEPIAEEAKKRYPDAKTQEEALARFKSDIDEVKRATAVLKQQAASRALSPEERVALVSAMKAHAGSSIAIFQLGDMEAGKFADELIGALREAGIRVDLHGAGAMAPPRYGVLCNRSPIASALADALAKTSYKCEPMEQHPSLAQFDVIVGLKPSI